MNRVLIISFLLVSLSLSGCSTVGRWFGRESPADLAARQGKALEVPPSMNRSMSTDLMSIPGEKAGPSVSLSSADQANQTAGEQGAVLKKVKGVKVIRRGERSWLEVDQDVDQVFSRLVDFFAESKIILQVNEPKLGLLETDWIDSVVATPKRFLGMVIGPQIKDRFRVRIERGQESGTSEVFFTHYAAELVMVEDARTGNVAIERVLDGNSGENLRSDWIVRPADPEAEIEMMRRFIAYLEGEMLPTAEIKAASQPVERISHIVENEEGHPYSIVLQSRFFEAWRLVGLAIDRANFTITDQDRSMGRYYVRFDPTVGKENKKGFWATLAFWKKDEAISAGIFSFLVTEENGVTRLIVQDEQGESIPPELSHRILVLLDEQLD